MYQYITVLFPSCQFANHLGLIYPMVAWRGGRVVDCTGLENRRRLVAYRGFESHPLRQCINYPQTLLVCEGEKGLVTREVSYPRCMLRIEYY